MLIIIAEVYQVPNYKTGIVLGREETLANIVLLLLTEKTILGVSPSLSHQESSLAIEEKKP